MKPKSWMTIVMGIALGAIGSGLAFHWAGDAKPATASAPAKPTPADASAKPSDGLPPDAGKPGDAKPATAHADAAPKKEQPKPAVVGSLDASDKARLKDVLAKAQKTVKGVVHDIAGRTAKRLRLRLECFLEGIEPGPLAEDCSAKGELWQLSGDGAVQRWPAGAITIGK